MLPYDVLWSWTLCLPAYFLQGGRIEAVSGGGQISQFPSPASPQDPRYGQKDCPLVSLTIVLSDWDLPWPVSRGHAWACQELGR